MINFLKRLVPTPIKKRLRAYIRPQPNFNRRLKTLQAEIDLLHYRIDELDSINKEILAQLNGGNQGKEDLEDDRKTA